MKDLIDQLNIADAQVISLVGGGGKTTLLYRLAEEFSKRGQTTLATTTTKMYLPEKGTFQKVLLGKQALLDFSGGQKKIYSAGGIETELIKQGEKPFNPKVVGYSPADLDEVFREKVNSGKIDKIIIEADGSAGKPVKAPADHEPVLWNKTDTLIGIIGLTAFGKPIDKDTAHRDQLLRQITGETFINEEAIYRLVVHPKGLFKGGAGKRKILILNQADQISKEEIGKIMKKLQEKDGIIKEIQVHILSILEE